MSVSRKAVTSRQATSFHRHTDVQEIVDWPTYHMWDTQPEFTQHVIRQPVHLAFHVRVRIDLELDVEILPAGVIDPGSEGLRHLTGAP